MHSLIQEHLEDLLSGSARADQPVEVQRHLDGCSECQSEVAVLRRHSELLQSLRSPAELEVRAGFYARVLDRIEAQRPASGWMNLLESAFAFRIALASAVLALLMGTYIVTNEDRAGETTAQQQELHVIHEDQVPIIETGQPRDPDSVLVSLATYQEQ